MYANGETQHILHAHTHYTQSLLDITKYNEYAIEINHAMLEWLFLLLHNFFQRIYKLVGIQQMYYEQNCIFT